MASADEVKVSLKTVAGKQFVLTATDSTTIGTLKEKLSTEHDLDEVGMKLVYKVKPPSPSPFPLPHDLVTTHD